MTKISDTPATAPAANWYRKGKGGEGASSLLFSISAFGTMIVSTFFLQSPMHVSSFKYYTVQVVVTQVTCKSTLHPYTPQSILAHPRSPPPHFFSEESANIVLPEAAHSCSDVERLHLDPCSQAKDEREGVRKSVCGAHVGLARGADQ